MRSVRLGHTAAQLAEHQLGIVAEGPEEETWLREFVAEVAKGKPLYFVGLAVGKDGIISVAISHREVSNA